MLEKPMKTVLAVGLIALLLGPASLLLFAAGDPEASAMTRLDPGEQHWYTVTYKGNGVSVEVRMNVDPDGGASFKIVTPDAVRAWEAGEELEITGRGTKNKYEEADLTWSGSFDQPGTYHLIVEYSGNGQDTAFYSLDVSGADVSTDAPAAEEETAATKEAQAEPSSLATASASPLLVAADRHGDAAMTKLEPGAEDWHTLTCSGSGTVEIGMDVDPDGAAAFMIVTPDAVHAWEAGEELAVTGRGTDNPTEEAELFWSGRCIQGQEFYLVVEYTGDGVAPSAYSLHVSGAEVAGTAAADGLWCYMPVFDKIAPITFDPYEGNPAKAFWQVPYVSEWSGFLNGSSKDYGLVIIHVLDPGPPPVEAPVLFIDTSTFTDAEVGGVSGGLEVEAMGDLDPSGQWRGTWKVTSGTGGLEALQAHGTFWGPGWLPPDGGSDECPEGMGVVYYSVED